VKRQHPEYSRVEIAGAFRRGCELISDLALVAQGKTGDREESSSLKLTDI
jgi:DNA polymerase (family 10)